ncbi:3064_t:CDS:2 [Cetraspora pellucida]|uniref:3064_t:CDS:1 n=1 Tax=Cetraspora pellucida TaxID=1433469 RepID=A0A9N9A9P4_9GLOM|nr:3064_t:CDS:2 [Cetraspora pellucida]
MEIVWVSAIPVAELPEKRDNALYTSNIFEPLVLPDKSDQPQVRKYTFKLSSKELSPDGFSRTCYLVNDQYPGPIIQAYKGDTISVEVVNDLSVETAMHWHGMFQRGTPWYDGVPGMTQCLLASKSSLTYEFSVDEQSGTYWWHSHYKAQYLDGILGPLIIHDKNDPYVKEYDYELVLTLTDWYHAIAGDLLAGLLTPGYKGLNVSLVSGKGRYNCDAAPGSKCVKNSPYAVYKVKKGKKYRFRIINTSAEAFFALSIDSHTMKVIEVEGTLVKSVEVKQIALHVAQRFSVIVEANQEVGNFWIRANMSKSCIANNNFTINTNSAVNYDVRAILSYEGADDKEPTSSAYPDEVKPCRNLDSKLLKPLIDSPCPEKTESVSFNVTFDKIKNVTAAKIDNSSYVPTFDSPTLLQIINDGINVKDLPTTQNIQEFDNENGVVEITVFNTNPANHPFHLHGQTFYLLGEGSGQKVNETLNTNDPPIRDTTVVPSNGWSVIRFKTDNPGVWNFHCHIEWHIEIGMVKQLIVNPSKIRSLKVPDSVKNLCKAQTY